LTRFLEECENGHAVRLALDSLAEERAAASREPGSTTKLTSRNGARPGDDANGGYFENEFARIAQSNSWDEVD
jgi:hypothetical protein